MKRLPIDPELLRDRLAPEQGRRYWRSLDELAEHPSVKEMLQREFPDRAGELTNPVTRRRFLALMGASLALAGFSGCARPPAGTIMPYVNQPEEITLGKPLFYATTLTLGGFGTGVLVESHEGRPTKIEGNKKHPASLGATSAQHQASILDFYDPDRSQTVLYRGQTRTWASFLEDLRRRLHRPGKATGKGVAIISESIGSPTLAGVRNAFLSAYPEATWAFYEPVNRDASLEGTQLVFGTPYHVYSRVAKADVIVAIDADFLTQGPGHLADARAFSTRRREGGKDGMNRLYAIETNFSTTGASADNRLAIRPSFIEPFTRALAAKVGVAGIVAPDISEPMRKFVDAIAADLKSRPKGRTLLVVGEGQPALVHALVAVINNHLGNVGSTVFYTEPLSCDLTNRMASLREVYDAIVEGKVHTLLMVGGNPAYTAPADVPLNDVLIRQLKKPREQWLAVHLGSHFDETSRVSHWHIPESHFLESWGDAVAFDGTASIVQPLIAPLYQGRTALEVVAGLTPLGGSSGDFDERSPHDLVRDYWRTNQPATDQSFDRWWRKALHEGVIEGTAWKTETPVLVANLGEVLSKPDLGAVTDLDISFSADPGVHDGRFANNGWLQEWPRPITRLTWDNAALMSDTTAYKLKLKNRIGAWKGGEHGDTIANMVRLKVGSNTLEVPVFIVPGHADDSITLHLGYGRWKAGKVGTGAGFNANRLRLSTSPGFLMRATVTKRSKTYKLACVQAHHSVAGRDIVRGGTVTEYKKNPHFAHKHDQAHKAELGEGKKHSLPTLYPDHPYDGYKWGMAIDMSACTGCGACVVACQAENNSPVIGKTEVLRGREMHWLRIDRYFVSPEQDRTSMHGVYFQPVMCQHCETAPCELVCPVEATVHGDEGTNDMVYNRCVGTRYCANNCPYKVRRFNFLEYSDYDTPSLKLMYNPEVTVRTRGVMEKCTFCIQRVSHARIESSKDALEEKETGGKARLDINRPGTPLIHDGEVVSACQAACPSQAIIFGDLNHRKPDKSDIPLSEKKPASEVARLFESPLRYDLLGELGTKPRVAYLAAVRNPNPELEAE